MSIPAKVSALELDGILAARYVGSTFEGRLINLPAYNYDPSVAGADQILLAGEVPLGTGGYQRALITFEPEDIGTYADGGVALTQKATVFAQDGGTTPINFSHVALVRSTGNILTFDQQTIEVPTAGNNGTYTNIPMVPGITAPTNGNGVGATFDLTIINNGAGPSDYALTVNNPGYGFAVGDDIVLGNAQLAQIGAVNVGDGGLTIEIGTVTDTANDLFSVAKTSSSVSLVDGNEAAFYWNVKQFGFYSAT